MGENSKSKKTIMISVGLIAAIAIAIFAYFFTSGKSDKNFIVGYWGTSEKCPFFILEIQKDWKIINWGEEKGKYLRSPITGSLVLTENNRIIYKNFLNGELIEQESGDFNRLSSSKFMIKNSSQKFFKDGKIVEENLEDRVYMRCDQKITENLRTVDNQQTSR